MSFSYFILAWRHILKHKTYASINLIGLTLGICCSLLVLLFIVDQLSYDQHYPDAERIYRLNYEYRNEVYSINGFVNWWEATSEEQLLKPNSLREIEGVEHVAQFNATHGATMSKQAVFISVLKDGVEAEKFAEKKILISNTGEEIVKVFGWELLYGNQEISFDQAYAAILTEETALRYFGKDWISQIEDKSIAWNNKTYPLKAVLRLEENAHFDFDLLLITPEIPSWGAYTYLKLAPGISPEQVDAEINRRLQLIEPQIADDPDENGSHLQAVRDIHFSNDILYELGNSGEIQYLYVFGAIALIILFITTANYINLSVAMYAKRKNEIGMRKVMGAERESITWQFLAESVLICLLSLPLALLLLEFCLPFFNSVMNLQLENIFLDSLLAFALLLSFTIFIGLLSGLYPALLLSGKQTLQLISNNTVSTREGLSMRRLMFVFQFTLLIALGAATILINRQLNYINQKNLGFNKKGVITFDPGSAENYRLIKNKLQQYPQILAVGSGMVPGVEVGGQTSYKLDGSEDVYDDASFWAMDWDALEALDIEISGIDKNTAPDQTLIINQAVARNIAPSGKQSDGNQLLGQYLLTHLEYQNEEGKYGDRYVIGGFVEDLHLFSLKQKISPIIIQVAQNADWVYRVIVKVETDKLSESLSIIRSTYDEVVDDIPIEITFLESSLQQLYEQEQRVGDLSFYLSIVAIVIALLGLVSMTAYLVSLRTREIGIRRVMGASFFRILLLLSKEFIILVVVATIIATPFAYLLVEQWLSDFAYHIEVSLWVFLITGFIALCIAVAVVIVQAAKTTNTQPAAALRSN